MDSEKQFYLLQPPHAKKKYQIHLKSHAGPISVLLVNKDTDSTSPVVVQVPPPRDDLLTQTTVDQNQNPALGQNPLKQPIKLVSYVSRKIISQTRMYDSTTQIRFLVSLIIFNPFLAEISRSVATENSTAVNFTRFRLWSLFIHDTNVNKVVTTATGTDAW